MMHPGDPDADKAVQAALSLAGDDGQTRQETLWSSVWASLVIIAICVACWIELNANAYLDFGQSESDPGPGLVPRAAILALFGCAAAHLVITLARARCRGGLKRDPAFSISRLWLPILLVGSLLAYYSVLSSVGYWIASVALCLVWIPVLHWRSGAAFSARRGVFFVVEAGLITSVIYGLFRYLILVPMP